MHICVVVTLDKVFFTRSRELPDSGDRSPPCPFPALQNMREAFSTAWPAVRKTLLLFKTAQNNPGIQPVILRAFTTSAALHGPSNSLGGECPARRSLQRSAGLAAHVAAISRRVQPFHPAFESMFFMQSLRKCAEAPR